MIIKKIDIGDFGKFSSCLYDIQSGFNLIYGGNEDGKTTLMAFVKMMFYSSSSKSEKSADVLKSLRKKYRPWNGAPMMGAVEFEEGGMEYRIQKEFLKSDASDKTTIYCKTTGEDLDIRNKNEAGEYFFKMTLDEFEKSVFIGSFGGFSSDGTADALAMRISNLVVSGDEEVSHEQILKRLSDAAEELVSKMRKKGLLVEEENKLDNLKIEKQQLIQLEESQKSIQAEIVALEREIQSLEKQLSDINNTEKAVQAEKELKLYYALRNKLNLLNSVKKQLADYALPANTLREYINKAKFLNEEIEDSLIRIQEITTMQADVSISSEEYNNIESLNKKACDLREDLGNLQRKITPLFNVFQEKMRLAIKSSVFSATIAFAIFIAVSVLLFFGVKTLPFAWIFPLGLGIITFLVMLFRVKKSVASNVNVQLTKRDLKEEISKLSVYDESLSDKNPDELNDYLNSLLTDTEAELSVRLAANNCSDLSQLRQGSIAAQTEKIKAISEKLELQKEGFIALAKTIKPVETFSAAKILYVELSESLSSLESITAEVDSLCAVANITDTSEEAVSNQIRHLSELAGKASTSAPSTTVSASELEESLRQKRTLLNEKMKLLSHPAKSLSALEQEISAAESRVSSLTQRLKEITIAREIMDEAILDTSKGFGSEMSKKVGEYLSKLSGGRYSDVLVPRDLNLETRTKSGDAYHEWRYLSGGAIDRVYLALRLAIADIVTADGEPLPLFFDDILTQYDDESCKNALSFLKEYLENSKSTSQIMFFTCHNHIVKAAKNIFTNINEISL